MDVEKVDKFECISPPDYLRNHPLGSTLQITYCHMLDLFCKLVRVLESIGCVSSSESRIAVEEYSTFVNDARRQHGNCGASAEDFADVRHYLLSDCSYLSRKTLSRVFRLCCLVALKPRVIILL